MAMSLDTLTQELSPVAYWPMYERELTGVLWLRGGEDAKTNGARQLTAANSEGLQAADTGVFAPGDADFTVAYWVRFDSLSGDQTTISCGGDSTSRAGVWHDMPTTGRMAFRFTDGSGAAVILGTLGVSDALVVDTWYLIVATHDRDGNAVAYVNNAAKVTMDISSQQAAFAAVYRTLFVGTHASSRYVDGRMSRIAFWTRLLTADELTWLYNSGSGRVYAQYGEDGDGAAMKTNLVNAWDLDEDSGNAIDFHGSDDLTDLNTCTHGAGPGLVLAGDGNRVAQWDDQSGNGNDAAQATGADQPLFKTAITNSLPVLRFDGSDDHIATSLAATVTSTEFLVAAKLSGGTEYLYGTHASRSLKLKSDGKGGYDKNDANASVTFNTIGAVDENDFHVFTLARTDHSALLPRIDGTSDDSFDPRDQVGNYAFGARSDSGTTPGEVDIAEFIAFDRLLSVAEYELVEGYLAHKYDLAGSLPSGHTYKSQDPGSPVLQDGVMQELQANQIGTAKSGVAISGQNIHAGAEGSYEFDGVNDSCAIVAAKAPSLWDSGDWAVVLAFHGRSDGGGNAGRLIEKGHVLNVQDESGGNVRIRLEVDCATTNGQWDTAVNVANATDHLVILNYNGGDAANNPALYLDGTKLTVGSGLTETTTPSGSIVAHAGTDMYVGNRADGARAFDGFVSNLAIFDRAISDDEAGAMYQAWLHGSAPYGGMRGANRGVRRSPRRLWLKPS